MPELLLELGCEELPATSVRRAYTQLHDLVRQGLKDAQIPYEGEETPLGTPRRLIVGFKDVAAQQPDIEKEVRGPGVAAAFDADGNPTKAVDGFCRSNGIEPAQLEKRDGYVWARKVTKGRPTQEVLAEIIPAAIRSMTFDKTMRWGSGRMRFARPIRWILACFDGQVISFDVEGVHSSDASRGHRFYAPEEFKATSRDQLLNQLLAKKVEADPEERRKTISEVATVTATGTPQISPELLDENVFLTEWPTPIEGSFKSEFLELPESVLETAMAKHEKMFPIRDTSGKLLNKFIFVRNSGEDAAVRSGAEWVLNARFNDAKFFHDEDKKKTFGQFLEETGRIVFQEKLGTVRQRADRLANLCDWIASQTGATPEEAEHAKQAGLYAKADLATGLVSELASLQGIIGGEYAKRHGLPNEVCQAIATQYDLAKASALSGSSGATAIRLLVADQLDKIVGYLGIGQVPSGSSDPMGIRRAVTICIEATWKRWNLDFGGLMAVAATEFTRQNVELDLEGAKSAARGIFAQRTAALLEDERYDVVEAAIMESHGDSAMRPFEVLVRLEKLKQIANDASLIQTLSRPLNILKSAQEKGLEFASEKSLETLNRTELNSAEGEALACALESATDLKSLQEPIHAFFENTMVMSENPAECKARLTLVAAACETIMKHGDVSKIVVEG